MPKKFNILSALAVLSISTLGAVVPTFAEAEEYYYAPELVELHAKYAADMAACGDYSYTNSYLTCYNNITDAYREQYGGLFESMFQLDFNGRMIVTGINPTTNSLRFYIDETRAFTDEAFEFENLVIYWADTSAANSPDWSSEVQWEFSDNYFATGEIPAGFHVLYGGKRGEEGWINANTENRVIYGDDTTLEGLVFRNPNNFIHLTGYDTLGNRHTERNYLSSCMNSDLFDGSECRLQYTYVDQDASPEYIVADPSEEDAMIIALKKAIKAKEEAEARLAEIETELNEARSRAEAAEMSYMDALERQWDLENSIMGYQMDLEEARNNLSSAENELLAVKAELESTQAELQAHQSELKSAQAELLARESELEATQAELADTQSALANIKMALAGTEAELANIRQALNETESRAVAELEIAQKKVEEAQKNVEETQKNMEEAKKAASSAEKRAEEAKKALEEAQKNAEEAIRRAEELASNQNTVTVYKTIEKLVKDTSPENNVAEASVSKIDEQNSQTLEKTSEDQVEVPLARNDEHNFPWWIVVFAFTGIALVLWWFIPSKRKTE